jgi:hypothetical protein
MANGFGNRLQIPITGQDPQINLGQNFPFDQTVFTNLAPGGASTTPSTTPREMEINRAKNMLRLIQQMRGLKPEQQREIMEEIKLAAILQQRQELQQQLQAQQLKRQKELLEIKNLRDIMEKRAQTPAQRGVAAGLQEVERRRIVDMGIPLEVASAMGTPNFLETVARVQASGRAMPAQLLNQTIGMHFTQQARVAQQAQRENRFVDMIRAAEKAFGRSLTDKEKQILVGTLSREGGGNMFGIDFENLQAQAQAKTQPKRGQSARRTQTVTPAEQAQVTTSTGIDPRTFAVLQKLKGLAGE